MKHKHSPVLAIVFAISLILQALLTSVSLAEDGTFDRVRAEIEGAEQKVEHSRALQSDPVYRTIAVSVLPQTGYLLIPESTNDRVMAFDPANGNLVDADFIPSDPAHLNTPIHAVLSADGNSILVSDQLEDVVQQYDLNGNYVGVFAPAGGVDTSILDNIRGMALRPNGNLLVTVGGGANANAVAEFDTSGNYLGNFVANGAGGLDSPFDVLLRSAQSDYLVGGITSDKIHRYDLTGASLGDFFSIDTFPEQIALADNGNVLIGNFSGIQEGVVELTTGGALVGVYTAPGLGSYRGVYELPNGNILTTTGSGVFEIDRLGNLVDTKIAGVSAHFIQFVQPSPPPPVVPILSEWGMLIFFLVIAGSAPWVLRRRLQAA